MPHLYTLSVDRFVQKPYFSRIYSYIRKIKSLHPHQEKRTNILKNNKINHHTIFNITAIQRSSS